MLKSRFFLMLAVIMVLFNSAYSQDYTNIVLSVAQFDIFNPDHKTGESRIEVRQEFKSSQINPLVGMMANFDGARFVYLGVYVDWMITDGLYLTPSFAPGFYSKGWSKDLHFLVEFRSQLDLSFHVKDRYRLGININHMSNASLAPINPGVESLAFYVLIPISNML